jgi:hypothetical protein
VSTTHSSSATVLEVAARIVLGSLHVAVRIWSPSPSSVPRLPLPPHDVECRSPPPAPHGLVTGLLHHPGIHFHPPTDLRLGAHRRGPRRLSSFCHRRIVAAAATSCLDWWERVVWLDLFSDSARFLVSSTHFPTGSARLSQSSPGSFWLVSQLRLAGSR